MGCATQLVKLFLFITNFIFVLCGVALIVFGALTVSGYQTYLKFVEDGLSTTAYQAPPIILIVIGSIVFVIAFAGCCGAMRESNCLMMTYGALVFLIMLMAVGLTVAIAVNQDDVKKFFGDEMRKSMSHYGGSDEAGREATKAWDAVQKEAKCCGVESPADWMTVSYKLIPDSCCIQPGCLTIIPTNIYGKGCLKKLIEDIGIKWLIIGGSIFSGALLVAVILACCLAARFRRKVYHS